MSTMRSCPNINVGPGDTPRGREYDKKVNTLEGDTAQVSLDYTLSEEGEGDNISGNEELRGETEHEDETNSKRPKVPLQPPTTE